MKAILKSYDSLLAPGTGASKVKIAPLELVRRKDPDSETNVGFRLAMVGA